MFRFSEGTERCLVDRMRDLDEIVAQMKELYPENTWSRSDLLTLFFLDDIGDGILRLVQRDTEA